MVDPQKSIVSELKKNKISENSQSQPTNPKKSLFFLIPILILVVIITILSYFQMKQTSSKSSKNTGTKIFTDILHSPEIEVITNTPTSKPRQIPSGKTEFNIGQSDKTVPQLSKGSIDPYDPSKGSTQVITIKVKNDQPVTKVTAILKTDNNTSNSYPFKLITGTDTDGEWQGSWTVENSHLYTYELTLNAVSSNGTGTITTTLR